MELRKNIGGARTLRRKVSSCNAVVFLNSDVVGLNAVQIFVDLLVTMAAVLDCLLEKVIIRVGANGGHVGTTLGAIRHGVAKGMRVVIAEAATIVTSVRSRHERHHKGDRKSVV